MAYMVYITTEAEDGKPLVIRGDFQFEDNDPRNRQRVFIRFLSYSNIPEGLRYAEVNTEETLINLDVEPDRPYLGWYNPTYGSITWTTRDFMHYGISGFLPILGVYPFRYTTNIIIEGTGYFSESGDETFSWAPRHLIEPTEKMVAWAKYENYMQKKGHENEAVFYNALERNRIDLGYKFHIFHDDDSGRGTGLGDILISQREIYDTEDAYDLANVAIEVFRSDYRAPFNKEQFARWYMAISTKRKRTHAWSFRWCNTMLNDGIVPVFAYSYPPFGEEGNDTLRWIVAMGPSGEKYLNECWMYYRPCGRSLGKHKKYRISYVPIEQMMPFSISTREFLNWVESYLSNDGLIKDEEQ